MSWNRGFGRLIRAAWTPCGLCGMTRQQHNMGERGTTKHEFITRTALRRLDSVEQLALSTRFAQEEHPLPRCGHGAALRDHGGARLEPPCGCRIDCPECGGTGRRSTARSANGRELERHEKRGTPCALCEERGAARRR